MAARSLNERVDILEQKVEELQKLPARMDAVESQILQLRDEMRDGFSAIRQRLDGHDQRFVAIDGRLEGIDGRLGRLETGNEEIKRHMRVLHEDVLSRLSLLQEGRGPRRKR